MAAGATMQRPSKITALSVRDIRFPTSLELDGSDAVHLNPDYAAGYVVIETDTDAVGYGLSFTLGRGNDIVCTCIRSFARLVVGHNPDKIFQDFGKFWDDFVNESQARWLGPEKGVTHLATAGIMNALWDLWARLEGKPLWKMLVDMEPEQLVSTIPFRYLSDALTKEEAIAMLKQGRVGREEREAELRQTGFPAYTTSAGWMGYSDDKIKRLCQELMGEGFTRFKVKVGSNQEDDIRRVALIRQHIGEDKLLMTDANQRWDVAQAIDWMKPMAKYNVLWIEEPTSPDDILGHAAISKGLAPYGIGVATGEHCQNRVMFKQFLQASAMQFCQVDACRLGGPNEMLAVYLMAKKFKVPVCPHAGGVGLCELVHHLSLWDYCCVAGTKDQRMVEYVTHLHEHFFDPVVVKNGAYMPLQKPGYSCEMKPDTLDAYEYPTGSEWVKLINEGSFDAIDI